MSSTSDTPVSVKVPNRVVFDISMEKEYPNWFTIPAPATLTISGNRKLPSNLPPVSKLWFKMASNYSILNSRCPLLKEIRFFNFKIKGENRVPLINFLQKRKELVQAKQKINGDSVVPIDVLIITFKALGQDNIPKLHKLVGQLIDMRRVHPLKEMFKSQR